MKHALIKLNIERAYKALKGELTDSNGRIPYGQPLKPIEQAIYDSYPEMFAYFYHLEGLGQLYYRQFITDEQNRVVGKEKVLYNKERDGLKPFGLKKLLYLYTLIFKTDDSKIIRLKRAMPLTKSVGLARSKF